MRFYRKRLNDNFVGELTGKECSNEKITENIMYILENFKDSYISVNNGIFIDGNAKTFENVLEDVKKSREFIFDRDHKIIKLNSCDYDEYDCDEYDCDEYDCDEYATHRVNGCCMNYVYCWQDE